MASISMPVNCKKGTIIYKTMNKKSFFLGVVTGIVLTFVGLFVIGLVNQNSTGNAPIQYLEKMIYFVSPSITGTVLGIPPFVV